MGLGQPRGVKVLKQLRNGVTAFPSQGVFADSQRPDREDVFALLGDEKSQLGTGLFVTCARGPQVRPVLVLCWQDSSISGVLHVLLLSFCVRSRTDLPPVVCLCMYIYNALGHIQNGPSAECVMCVLGMQREKI